ncbi:DNA cytosine methyltransferase (plasmid) [Brucella pseudintermedia]|uniref:DNA cytosine methyltransferase n=1 Tax=Brucella pseudintermedia TaxID=370111 RepID=UPI002AC9D16F|nr:DNA cytosine methyltransferase [Brucella pseudintermedia]WPM83121.1 DNA cytosine methyltransferase [Brucella pseudintermedia]
MSKLRALSLFAGIGGFDLGLERTGGFEIVYLTRAGHTVVVRPPVHPRKGTAMVGGMSGYYEPEWDEEDAWSALECIVCHHFSEWDEESEAFYLTRPLPTVTSIFQAADEIIAERMGEAS